jgi:hypothetical protein
VRSAVPGSVDADAWIRFWANLCGGMLVVGFFFPMIFSGYRTTTVIWPWDLMSAMKAHQKLGMLLPLTLGLGAIAIGNLTRGLPRAIALSVTAGSVWVLYALLAAAPEMDLAHLSAKPGSGVPLLVLMPLSACAIAIGNRIRKRHPTQYLPRTVAGVGGIVLSLCFVIPITGGRQNYPIIAAFFEPMFWRTVGPMMVALLALLIYGILGSLSFLPFRNVAAFCRFLSIQARVLLWGAPATVLFNFLGVTRGEAMVPALTVTIKIFTLWYGHLLLFAVGLTAWIEHAMEGRSESEATAIR